MPIVVSDELLRSIGMSEEEVRSELAVLLFERGRCTLARASHLAGMNRIGFQKLLQARGSRFTTGRMNSAGISTT